MKKNYKKIHDDLVQWIKNWFSENGNSDTKAIIGISGGKDSTTVASLCVEALGVDRVIGVLMPCGTQHDIKDSYNVVNSLGIKYYVANIEKSYKATIELLKGANQKDFSNLKSLTLGNLQARERMKVLYAISQELNGRVSNNCNASEIFVGYSTRFGDDAGDFSPLANLTVSDIKELGKYLKNTPIEFINKTPIDGLENNKDGERYLTDEDSLGFSYEQLDNYISNGSSGDKEIDKLILEKHKNTEFKRKGHIDRFPLV